MKLTSRFTVAQFLARDDFNKRFTENKPIAITEFLYPLMQAYDSVAIESDVECGGTDQKFNFLVGRELQGMMGQRPQQCFMAPLLVGTDGVQKMSKSLGNYIGITEPPEIIFGKTMSIRDEEILTYMELLTDIPDAELAEFRRDMERGTNPMTLKKRLARELILQLYNVEAADEAEAHFAKVVQNKEVPDDIPSLTVTEKEPDIRRLLVDNNFLGSMSEATRLIKQGGIKVDGEKITAFNTPLKNGSVIQAGKRLFVKIVM